MGGWPAFGVGFRFLLLRRMRQCQPLELGFRPLRQIPLKSGTNRGRRLDPIRARLPSCLSGTREACHTRMTRCGFHHVPCGAATAGSVVLLPRDRLTSTPLTCSGGV